MESQRKRFKKISDMCFHCKHSVKGIYNAAQKGTEAVEKNLLQVIAMCIPQFLLQQLKHT